MSSILSGRPRGFILDIVSSKGGDTGDVDYSYPGWKRVVNKMPRLSELRESLAQLSSACLDVASDKWMSRLSSSRWLSHIKDVLNTACLAAQCLERVEAGVLLTEMSGVDLSLAVSSLAQIILNPDTRTIHGFEALIERDWIQAGHPFWSRGSSATNNTHQQAPVFLLFLGFGVLHKLRNLISFFQIVLARFTTSFRAVSSLLKSF